MHAYIERSVWLEALLDQHAASADEKTIKVCMHTFMYLCIYE